MSELSIKKKKEIDLTTGNLFIKIIKVALPLMLSGVLQLFYNAADLIVCGKFGSENSVAAISSTNSLINLIIGLFTGLSVGASVLMARAYGAKDRDRAYKVTHTSILLSLILGIVIGIFGLIFNRTFLVIMKSPIEVIDLSSQYLFIYFLGLPFSMVYNFGSALLRSTGDTKRPFYFLAGAGLINVLLNLLLVIVFHLDVAGVAIATITAQGISALLVVICLMKTSGFCHLNIKEMKLYGEEVKDIIRIGLPAGFQSMLFSISNVIIQSSVNSLGPNVMNGNGASNSLEGFVYITMNSFAQTCITFVSANYGAYKKENINKSIIYSIILMLSIGLSISGIILIFGEPLLNLYIDNPLDISYGLQRLKIILLTYFLCGLMDVFALSLRGIGYSFVPTVVSLLGVCGIRLLWIFLVFPIKEFHNLGSLVISYPISWFITALIQFVLLITLKKKVFNRMNNSIQKN